MEASKRKDLMKQHRANAKREDARGDAGARNRAAKEWRQLATEAEIKRAPKYLQDWR